MVVAHISTIGEAGVIGVEIARLFTHARVALWISVFAIGHGYSLLSPPTPHCTSALSFKHVSTDSSAHSLSKHTPASALSSCK